MNINKKLLLIFLSLILLTPCFAYADEWSALGLAALFFIMLILILVIIFIISPTIVILIIESRRKKNLNTLSDTIKTEKNNKKYVLFSLIISTICLSLLLVFIKVYYYEIFYEYIVFYKTDTSLFNIRFSEDLKFPIIIILVNFWLSFLVYAIFLRFKIILKKVLFIPLFILFSGVFSVSAIKLPIVVLDEPKIYRAEETTQCFLNIKHDIFLGDIYENTKLYDCYRKHATSNSYCDKIINNQISTEFSDACFRAIKDISPCLKTTGSERGKCLSTMHRKSWTEPSNSFKSGMYLIIQTDCPIDLSITDSKNITISKKNWMNFQRILKYKEEDINWDGIKDDALYVWRKDMPEGEYIIKLIPESNA